MTIQQLADAHIGHPEEIGEDSCITAQRESFKCGALKALQEVEKVIPLMALPYSITVIKIMSKINELKEGLEI